MEGCFGRSLALGPEHGCSYRLKLVSSSEGSGAQDGNSHKPDMFNLDSARAYDRGQHQYLAIPYACYTDGRIVANTHSDGHIGPNG
jgi:hypothetical protein